MKEGTKLGHYEIISAIGKGGMGEVYLAEDTKLDRKVAVKFLNEEFSRDADKLNRFIQEAKSTSALNHPSILTVYEIGEIDGKNYIATEFIDGRTLRERLSADEEITLNQILKIGIQVTEALSAAHQAGIIHRDIKPENIMIRQDGYAKVLDFGLAKLTEKKRSERISLEGETKAFVQTSPGMVMGTVSYMSPEQARGKEIDARTDLWSLGVVLYEMLAEKLPFTGETVNHTIISILEKEPKLLENVPDELQRIVRKALTKDKEMRYQTARDLLIDLKNLRRDLDIQGELERSVIPNRETNKTSASENKTRAFAQKSIEDTNDEAKQRQNVTTVSSLEYAVTQAKSHKFATAIIGIILLGTIAAIAYFGYFAKGDARQIESIAVMPFTNGSGNPEVDYLSDGMTETLISSLSQLPNLNIKPRSVVFRYKGREADPQTIGSELNVQAVLIGRVASRGSDLSLFVELIDIASTKVIWSRQYNRQQNEIVSLQSEIARDISGKLKSGLTNEEEKKVTRNYTDDPEAYRLYLRGNALLNRRKSKDVRMGIEVYEQAIALDPKYALAYTGLANAHLFLVIYGGAPPTEEFPKARAAALKSLELDPTLPSAHIVFGVLAFFQDRDFDALERGTRRALEFDPNNAGAHRTNGLRLAWLGRFDEAFAAYRRSLELEPLLLVTNVNYGWCLFYAGRVDESDAQLKVSQEIDPSFWFTEYHLFINSRKKGNYVAAVEHLARAHELRDEPEVARFSRAAFQKGGWRGFIESALEAPEGSKTFTYYRATFAAELGKKDKAFALLGEAYDKHDQFMFMMKIDPFMDPLREDPRFDELLKKLGFPQ